MIGFRFGWSERKKEKKKKESRPLTGTFLQSHRNHRKCSVLMVARAKEQDFPACVLLVHDSESRRNIV